MANMSRFGFVIAASPKLSIESIVTCVSALHQDNGWGHCKTLATHRGQGRPGTDTKGRRAETADKTCMNSKHVEMVQILTSDGDNTSAWLLYDFFCA